MPSLLQMHHGNLQLTTQSNCEVNLGCTHLEIENDGPYQAQDNRWPSVSDVSGIYVD